MASRRNNFMPSQFAGKAKPEEPTAPRAPVQREKRMYQGSGSSWLENWRNNAIGRMRINGRHSAQPIDRAELAEFFKETGIGEDVARAAFEAGRRDAAAGLRCMCPACEGQVSSEAEGRRSAYLQRRLNELTGGGLSYAAARKQIDDEIAEGKATE